MPLQAPRGIKMGSLPCATLSRFFRVEWDLPGLVLRLCRIGATSSWRNWTRIPLGTENCRSLLSGSHARKGVSVETGILPALPSLEVYHGRALYGAPAANAAKFTVSKLDEHQNL